MENECAGLREPAFDPLLEFSRLAFDFRVDQPGRLIEVVEALFDTFDSSVEVTPRLAMRARVLPANCLEQALQIFVSHAVSLYILDFVERADTRMTHASAHFE